MIPLHTLSEDSRIRIPHLGMDMAKEDCDASGNMDGIVSTSEDEQPTRRRNSAYRLLIWYLTWAIPGLGMFSEAYIVFSSGQIGNFQKAMWPSCYVSYIDCEKEMVLHVASYIQICGIIAGMLLWGPLGDMIGRKWGSISVSVIMLSGCILLTFSPWAPCAYCYFVYFMVAQTWYGFGVGGEYPMASASAAELSEHDPKLFALRGRQVILVFSNQGMGNFVNAAVIAICMAIFGETGPKLSFTGSRNVLALMYGFGTVACLVMVLYRFIFLKESVMYEEAQATNAVVINSAAERRLKWTRYFIQLKYYWPRLWVASAAWIANDFAFYGNKLFQTTFLKALFPTATAYKKQQWTILNNFVALTGYYFAAWLVDKPWYGRRRMQVIGFMWMFVLYLICGLAYKPLTSSPAAYRVFQALYYLSSFWNQFGPNATTWLVAGEMFPTDVRGSYHGFNAAMGKVGAIISALWFSYVGNRMIFILSAIFGVAGAVVTWVWMADTTLLNLHEYDRMNACLLLGKFHEYHGEAVNPKHLSMWEIYVLGWHKNYNPELDAQQREQELNCKK